MISWTIEHHRQEDCRHEVTVNIEGKLTSRDCAGIFTLCFNNFSHCDHLIVDFTRVEEKDGSIPVLICCLSKTAGHTDGRISLRGISPSWQTGPITGFMGVPEGAPCVFHNDCHSSAPRIACGVPPFWTRPGDET